MDSLDIAPEEREAICEGNAKRLSEAAAEIAVWPAGEDRLVPRNQANWPAARERGGENLLDFAARVKVS
jgi:hypothetical protein